MSGDRRCKLLGQRFGRLLVVAEDGLRERGMYWRCLCDCGKETTAWSGQLNFGKKKSCGCLGIERRAEAASAANTTHGMTGTKAFQVWSGMRRRCKSSRHKSYKDYGGRGIRVCQAWLQFDNFFADMGSPPPGMTLEREDVNGNYEPGNCKWATQVEQARNRRNNKPIEAFGDAKLIVEWSEDSRCVVDLVTLNKRFSGGWSPEEALLVPRCQRRATFRRLAGAAL